MSYQSKHQIRIEDLKDFVIERIVASSRSKVLNFSFDVNVGRHTYHLESKDDLGGRTLLWMGEDLKLAIDKYNEA